MLDEQLLMGQSGFQLAVRWVAAYRSDGAGRRGCSGVLKRCGVAGSSRACLLRPPSPKSLIRYSFMTKGVMTEAGYTLGSVLGGSVVHRKCRVGILHVQRVDVVRSCTLMSPFSAETR